LHYLHLVVRFYSSSTSHDDLLFVSQILTDFFALMRLELTTPDDKSIFDHRKITSRSSVSLSHDDCTASYRVTKLTNFLKATSSLSNDTPPSLTPFFISKITYLLAIVYFPFRPTSDGSRPSRSFFIRRMKLFFKGDVAGQSMRSVGATSLEENGVPPNLIQAIGRWASSAFQIYIRKNPVHLQALLFGRAAHDSTCRCGPLLRMAYTSPYHFFCI
jgi:hypothetical protein